MVNYVIGVDGGGTKTEIVAFDLNGEVIDRALRGFGNLLNGKEEGLDNILSGLKELIDKLGLEGLKGVYLGLAGSESGDNSKIVYEAIKKNFNVSSVIMNDSQLALKALLRGEDGILTIAGTGSIAFGIRNGQEARCGGWGNLLGDEGSGYKIAIEALKNMIYEYDYGFQLSVLSIEILKFLSKKEVNEIIEFVYSKTKDEIASITPIVAKLGEMGDEISIKILRDEGKAIAQTTERIFNKLNFESCKIGIVGGVLKKSKIVRQEFERYLLENIKVDAFIDEDTSPAKGAYYMYLKNFLV